MGYSQGVRFPLQVCHVRGGCYSLAYPTAGDLYEPLINTHAVSVQEMHPAKQPPGTVIGTDFMSYGCGKTDLQGKK